VISVTGLDVKAEAVRRQVPIYVLAARVGLHPSTLATYLNGHRALPATLERALLEALDELGRRPRPEESTGAAGQQGGGDDGHA